MPSVFTVLPPVVDNFPLTYNPADVYDAVNRLEAAVIAGGGGGGTSIYINVQESPYNAVGNGIANDTTAIQNALNAAGALGGATVFIPRGTFLVTTLSIPANCRLLGAGFSSVLKKSGTANDLISSVAAYIEINALTLDNTAGTNSLTYAVNFFGATQCLVQKVRLRGGYQGIGLINTLDSLVTHCRIEGVEFNAIQVAGGSGSCVIAQNVLRGFGSVQNNQGCGVKANFSGEGLVIADNLIDGQCGASDPAAAECGVQIQNSGQRVSVVGNQIQLCRGQGIVVDANAGTGTHHIAIVGNTVRNCRQEGITVFNTLSELVTIGLNTVKDCANNQIEVWQCFRCLVEGNIVEITGGTDGLHGIMVFQDTFVSVIGNFIYGAGWNGIHIEDSHDCIINGNLILDPNKQNRAEAQLGHFIQLNGASSNVLIEGNRIKDTRTAPANISKDGIHTENTVSIITVQGNDFSASNIGGSRIVDNAAGCQIRNNRGFVTENAGDGTIASGTTSVAITHSLGYTPIPSDICLVATNNPTNDPGTLWISGLGATTFTVNCRTDPGAGGLTFSRNVHRVF